jgi:Ca2+-binding EF-hand superfamily protein
MLNDDTITKLWNHFRECENKKNGRIPKKEFKNCVENVFNESYNYIVLAKDKKKLIIDLLFERFNYIPGLNSIDIYDFLISLSVLSRISNDEKIELILKLIDVDEDRCLSISNF